MVTLKPLDTKKTKKAAELIPFSLLESEILPRVVAKSDIGRCRCVCKQWKSFLSTATFARMHLHKHETIDDYKVVVFDGGQPSAPFRTLPLNTRIPDFVNPSPNPVFILASLDGLVCLGSRESKQLVFWNPLTGAYKKLSCGPRFSFSKKIATDAIGFYMDPLTGDYKLVCVTGGVDAFIYSHRLDSWRWFQFPFPSFEMCVWFPAIFCGQCLYFVVKAYTLGGGDWWIICFDVKTETFNKILFPPVPDGAMDRWGSLVLLNGSIHLCVSYKMTTYSKQADLWMLNGNGNGNGDGNGDDSSCSWVKVAGFSDPWDKELRVTRQHISTAASGNWVVVLDQEKSSYKKVNMEDFTTHYQYFSSPSWEYLSSRMIYVETLVSPNP